MTFTEAIQLAKAGDNRGFNHLYSSTYQEKYYLALKYMKDDAAAQDVLQDAYIKAFNKLDTLQDPEKFASWLGMIVTNTAKNELAKRNLISLDAYMENEDGDSFEREIADEKIENQPELAYTKQETQLLVHEMIDGLSEDQKMCILMFYMEKASIREIAEAMECSENTVKSRLNYGRKNLKAKAEELQKKGYKLYSLAPVAFLLWLLQTEYMDLANDGTLRTAGRQVAGRITANMPQLGTPSASSAQTSAQASSYHNAQNTGSSAYGDYQGANGNPYDNYQGHNGNPYQNNQGYGDPYGYRRQGTPDAATSGNGAYSGTYGNGAASQSAYSNGTYGSGSASGGAYGSGAAADGAYGGAAAGGAYGSGAAEAADAVGKTGFAAFIGTTTGKIVTIAASAAVVAGLVGGGVAIARQVTKDSGNSERHTIQIEQQNDGAAIDTDGNPDTEMRAENPFESAETVVSASSQETSAETEESTDLELAAAAFRAVIENHASYRYAAGDMGDWENNASHTYTYTYAFTEMTQDDVPELLLNKYDNDTGYEYIKIFYYDAGGAAVLSPEDTIQAGVAGVGGFRGGISGSSSGNGIYESTWSSGTGEGSVYRYSLSIGGDSATLSYDFVESFQIGESSAANSDWTEIIWYDISDTAGIDAYAAGTLQLGTSVVSDDTANTEAENANSGETDPSPEEDPDQPTLEADNITVFEGTIRYLTANELLALQGMPNPYGDTDISSFRYVVLLFDSPITLNANSGDGSGMRSGTANMIRLYRYENFYGSESGSIPDDMSAHDGQRAVVRFTSASDLWFPSDASLPLGEPGGTPAEIQYYKS